MLDASEAKSLYLVNDVVPKSEVLPRAVELAACTQSLNPDIVSLGRDLYYNTRCANPAEAIEQSRFALAAAEMATEERAHARLIENWLARVPRPMSGGE